MYRNSSFYSVWYMLWPFIVKGNVHCNTALLMATRSCVSICNLITFCLKIYGASYNLKTVYHMCRLYETAGLYRWLWWWREKRVKGKLNNHFECTKSAMLGRRIEIYEIQLWGYLNFRNLCICNAKPAAYNVVTLLYFRDRPPTPFKHIYFSAEWISKWLCSSSCLFCTF